MDIFTNQTNSLDFRCLTFDLKMAAEESEFSRFPVELFVCNNFHLGTKDKPMLTKYFLLLF